MDILSGEKSVLDCARKGELWEIGGGCFFVAYGDRRCNRHDVSSLIDGGRLVVSDQSKKPSPHMIDIGKGKRPAFGSMKQINLAQREINV